MTQTQNREENLEQRIELTYKPIDFLPVIGYATNLYRNRKLEGAKSDIEFIKDHAYICYQVSLTFSFLMILYDKTIGGK